MGVKTLGWKIEVDEGLLKELKRLSDKSIIEQAVKESGATLTRSMKVNAKFRGHYKNGEFVEPTGETKRSIEAKYKDGGLTVEVGPQTKYAPYLEYGTRFMSAQPFVKKSLDNTSPKFVKLLRQAVEGGS